ncbi:hypothetical protein [Trinickia mobilis]|uniref:hypothetical protein n=1 Tax=Trinickia mobilis TaxID=2816356 RepID=UPI001A8F9FA0|nr:hypothetical protein [Trinickia mobilis]
MLTLSNYEVYCTLKSIAETTYPDRVDKMRNFSVEVLAQESRTRHGDYHPSTRKIRIYNLSRKTAFIIKTTIHELAHHVDCCFYGKTAHDLQFYTTYKHLLETAHVMGVINIADVTDEIDARDILQLEKKAGRLVYDQQVAKDGLLIKVDRAFDIRDLLKERGYRYSATEKVWVLECDDSILEDEQGWLHGVTDATNVKVVRIAENTIESVYFCILGKNGFYGRQDELKELGFRFDQKKGWLKRIPAAEQASLARQVEKQFGVKATFRGKL